MNLQPIINYVILPILTLAVALAFIRLVRGPTLPDRVVALDLITTLGIAMVAVHAISINEAIFLDVGSIIALISFLGTIAFAYYVQRRV